MSQVDPNGGTSSDRNPGKGAETKAIRDVEDPLVGLNRALVWWTRVLAFCAVAAVVVSYLQWRAIRESEPDTKKILQANQDMAAGIRNQALNTGKLVDQAKASATAAQASAGFARDQIQVAREGERPRIYLLDAESTGLLIFDSKGAHLALDITMKNSGGSDAQHAFPFGVFVMTPLDFDKSREITQKVCGGIRTVRDSTKFARYGTVVSREETRHVIGVFNMSPKDVAIWSLQSESAMIAVPRILGCVDYVFDGRHHQTTFAYEVDKSGPGNNPFHLIRPQEGNVEKSAILLGMNPGLGGQSD